MSTDVQTSVQSDTVAAHNGRDGTSRAGLPFIPPVLDDANLTAVEFRVACHIYRRCGKDSKCWETLPKMWKHCRINKKTLVKVLKRLVDDFNMFDKQHKNGQTCVFTPIAHEFWRIPSPIRGPAQSEPYPKPKQGPIPRPKEALPQAQSEPHKVTPLKVLPNKIPNEGISPGESKDIRKLSTWELGKIQESLNERADEIKCRYYSECALGGSWTDQEKREEHRLLRRKSKAVDLELSRRI